MRKLSTRARVAIEQRPDDALAHSNLGMVLNEVGTL